MPATATLAMAVDTTPTIALELQALKTELQRTLARLGGASSNPRTHTLPSSPWSQASATTSTTNTTATTPTTVRSDSTGGRHSHASPAQSDVAARIMEELVATARRRRQVEMHLARELEREMRDRDQEDDQNSARVRVTQHTAVEAGTDNGVSEMERAIRGEIETLRIRRKQILCEIDNESKVEDAGISSHCNALEESRDSNAHTSNQPVPLKHHGDQEYSIEGIVKFGTLLPRRSTPESTSQSSQAIPQTQQSQPPSQFLSFLQPSGCGGYRHRHHDTMQDVFAIQLKFAETMLQLEKSIQTRDQLLVTSSAGGVRRRSVYARRNSAVRRRSRAPPTIHEDLEEDPAESSGGDENARPEGGSSDDASLSEDTLRLWRRYRSDRLRPASGIAHRSLSIGESVASTKTSTSPNSQPSPQTNENTSTTSPARTAMPSPEGENLVTPSTNDSGNKQVRFTGNDEYPTPLVARNISFDQDSIDSSDEEQTPATRRSLAATYRQAPQPPRKRTTVALSDDEALSFLEGSSVCSADLNDESFLIAFYAMRKELQRDRLPQRTPPPATPMKVVQPEAEEVPEALQAQADDDLLDLTTLRQQKRNLALDIQALTAKLVLAENEAQREDAAAALERLRQQLQKVEAQEGLVATVRA